MGFAVARTGFRRMMLALLGAGLLAIVLAPVARADTVSIRHRNLEGKFVVRVGGWIAVGYRFRFAPTHPAASVRFAHPAFTSVGARCVGTSAPVTLEVTALSRTYAVAGNDSRFFPGKHRADPTTFQRSVRYGIGTADLCHGRPIALRRGFSFSADVSSVPANVVPTKIQFHYRLGVPPGSLARACASRGPAGCGAGWSVAANLSAGPVTYTPSISTAPLVPVGLGGSMGDTASITGAAPAAGGTVTFTAFGPADEDCLGPPIFMSTILVSADSSGTAAVASDVFSLTQFGRYMWTAAYSGDPGTGTQPAASGCGDEVVNIVASGP